MLKSFVFSVSLCLCGGVSLAQTPKPAPKPEVQSPKPELSAEFSKAAVKALLTIKKNDQHLTDAAMVDLEAAADTKAEADVTQQIKFFETVYGIHQQEEDLGQTSAHDEDRACLTAWLPKLRAQSGEIPKDCK
jgi:hypothetical protein